MILEHIALYVNDLEAARRFFMDYFGAQSNEGYFNPRTGLRTYFLTMMNMSMLAAVAGILFVGRSTAAGPSDGNSWEMDAIASVFIGGASVSGGVGTILATMVGGMVMAVLNNGLMLMGVGADKTQVIKGLVLLLAVTFDVYNKKAGKESFIDKLLGGKKKKEK